MEISNELNPAMVDWLKNAGFEPSYFTEEGLRFVTALFNAILQAREEVAKLNAEIKCTEHKIQNLKQSLPEESKDQITVQKMIEIQKQIFEEEEKLRKLQNQSLALAREIANLKA